MLWNSSYISTSSITDASWAWTGPDASSVVLVARKAIDAFALAMLANRRRTRAVILVLAAIIIHVVTVTNTTVLECVVAVSSGAVFVAVGVVAFDSPMSYVMLASKRFCCLKTDQVIMIVGYVGSLHTIRSGTAN